MSDQVTWQQLQAKARETLNRAMTDPPMPEDLLRQEAIKTALAIVNMTETKRNAESV